MSIELPRPACLTFVKQNVRLDQVWYPSGASCPLLVVCDGILAGSTRAVRHTSWELFATFEHGCAIQPEVIVVGPPVVPYRRCDSPLNRRCTIRVFAEDGCRLRPVVTEPFFALVWTCDDVYDEASDIVDLGLTVVFPHDTKIQPLTYGECVESKVYAGHATNIFFKFRIPPGAEQHVKKDEAFIYARHGCAIQPVVKKFNRPITVPPQQLPSSPALPPAPVAVGIVLTSPEAEVPRKATLGAAGFDLVSVESVVIPGDSHKRISTGLTLAIPDGYFGRIVARSGLSYLHGIIVGAGIIDSDYRGNISVLLFNTTPVPCDIGVGDRIAQLMIERSVNVDFRVKDMLQHTPRGAGGFGSTGK
jgi:dUTP pyrophosphatase